MSPSLAYVSAQLGYLHDYMTQSFNAVETTLRNHSDRLRRIESQRLPARPVRDDNASSSDYPPPSHVYRFRTSPGSFTPPLVHSRLLTLFIHAISSPGSFTPPSHLSSPGSFTPLHLVHSRVHPFLPSFHRELNLLLGLCSASRIHSEGGSCIRGASTKKRGQGKGRCSHEDSVDNSKTSRRKWSHAEDVALVNVVVEIVASGVYKCDNGFKPGYLTKVEEALKITCPNSGIKARPHMKSRLKSLKKDWFIVNDMICGIRHGTSGFDFDSTSNIVTAPDDVWENYLRNYPEARPWRLKSFPHYENCYVIFGNDRAIVEDASALEDAFEDVNDVHDSSSTSEPLTAPTEEFDATPISSRTQTTTADGRGNEAKKKRKVSNDVYIGDQMVAAAQIVANETFKVTSVIRVKHDLRDSFINAMAEVQELTDIERAIYGSKIMGHVELMAAFMTSQPESRLPWLQVPPLQFLLSFSQALASSSSRWRWQRKGVPPPHLLLSFSSEESIAEAAGVRNRNRSLKLLEQGIDR
ncbi:hypothetical protein Syun_023367 [Stephania yunnanensis]|uniref:Myb/SANT-like domain-containing protein n=1 Tax=Stephania yunnanensis TaxID=152371 RepID=A0AAP0I3B0_9MAGN